jgi:TolB protein
VTSGSELGWSWSPTGARLAILEGSRLSVLDVDSKSTTELGSLTRDHIGDTPVWSPDGTRLVYGARGGTLLSVDIETGDRSVVVQLPGEDLDSMDAIDYSPDGTRLAILNDTVPGLNRLYVVSADGSDVRVLLDDVNVDVEMAWSPDGARLAYLEFSDGAGMRIFVQTLDSDAPILVGEVAVEPVGAYCPFSVCGYPVWSPDGSRIALKGGYSEGGFEYFAVNANGQGEAERIDELTYRSWDGGWYSCERLLVRPFNNPCT